MVREYIPTNNKFEDVHAAVCFKPLRPTINSLLNFVKDTGMKRGNFQISLDVVPV